MNAVDISVIISTYNNPDYLEKVLWSYECQTYSNFEIIIADDGSGKSTENLVKSFSENSSLNLKHVWQEDKGFQKTKILNKAIVQTQSNYLIFTDGDCIARADFVETHRYMRRANCALSGGYFKLNAQISQLITKEIINSQNCFNVNWLIKQGQLKSFKMNKLSARGTKQWFLDTFTPTKATFDGMNVSCWKKDIIAVNGFDERMQYGGEDREIGERLVNKGLKFIQARYSLVCLHLEHERPYKTKKGLEFNKQIRKTTKSEKLSYTNFGINKNT